MCKMAALRVCFAEIGATIMRIFAACIIATGSVFGGCSSAPDRLTLQAGAGQQEIVRNGIPALVSNKKHVAMLRPNSRRFGSNQRVAFTLIVMNRSAQPMLLREGAVTALQTVGTKQVALKVYRHAELVEEENHRQTMAAVGAALSGFGNAMAASNAGYTNTTGTVYGPRGPATYSATTYDPVRAQVAQNIAADRTAADFERLKVQGEANMQALDTVILQDNTVMPGEWSGGTVVLDPPQKDQSKVGQYVISVTFDGEVHSFTVSQSGS